MAEVLRESGLVLEVKGDRAVVLMSASDFCQRCGLCVSRKDGMELEARNPAGAKVGDGVTVELEAHRIVTASLFLYVVPVIFMFAGYLVGLVIGRILAGQTIEGLGIIGAFAFLGLGFVFIARVSKRLTMDEWRPIIKSIGRSNERRITSSA